MTIYIKKEKDGKIVVGSLISDFPIANVDRHLLEKFLNGKEISIEKPKGIYAIRSNYEIIEKTKIGDSELDRIRKILENNNYEIKKL